MASKREEAARTRVVGRIACQPELAHTSGGEVICRLMVVKRAAGPASAPVRVGLYLKGALASRCARGLGEGDLIESFGDLGRFRPKARCAELLADVVRLYERAPSAEGGA